MWVPCGNPWKTTFDYTGNNVSRKTESGAGSSSVSVNEYTYDSKSNPSVNMNKYLRIVLVIRILLERTIYLQKRFIPIEWLLPMP